MSSSPHDPAEAETQALLQTCLHFAEVAKDIARQHFRTGLAVEMKADASPVTLADQAIEQEIRNLIAQKYPDHGMLGEEYGIAQADSPHRWVIDPIDGTRAFVSGYPLFGFLLAYVKHGMPEIGVISMPMLGEVYSGTKAGAQCNGRPISTSGQQNLQQALIYINEADKTYREQPEVFARLMTAGRDRRFAYDCYPHALLSAGHIDLVIDYDLKPHDILALRPVIEAAGGILTDWAGNLPGLDYSGAIVSAATPELHLAALNLLNKR